MLTAVFLRRSTRLESVGEPNPKNETENSREIELRPDYVAVGTLGHGPGLTPVSIHLARVPTSELEGPDDGCVVAERPPLLRLQGEAVVQCPSECLRREQVVLLVRGVVARDEPSEGVPARTLRQLLAWAALQRTLRALCEAIHQPVRLDP